MEYNYIDLFCGAGGLSLGFDKAGFKNLFSIEFNSEIARTYQRNFPHHNLIVDDIRNVSNSQIRALVGNINVDVIVGGPPCQGFSMAGNIGRTFVDDDRNSLFREFVRFVNILNPKMFIMENVANLATRLKGKTIKEIVAEFEIAGTGYSVEYDVLNTVNYEIAQERRRIVVVGIRNDIHTKFCYPKKSSNIKTVKDVIGDLPILNSGEKSTIPNHVAMKHSTQMLEKMSYIKDGGNRNDIPERIRPKSGDVRKYIRYNSNKPSVCVTGDMRKIFHYEQNRALTCRELARIQTFPDEFVFEGNSIQIQQQIGNAVPPRMAYLIAMQVKETLRNA